jgi:predicted MPP superfamily phosphohydrolase
MMWVRVVFGVVFLAALVAAVIYMYRRTVRDTVTTPWIRGVMGTLLGVLFLSVPALRFAFRDDLPPTWATTLVLIGWGILLYTLLTLVVVDVVRRFARRQKPADAQATTPESAERRLFLARAAATGALAVGSGAASFGTWRAFTPPEVTEVPVRLPGLPKALEGFTIVHLTDIHVGPIIQERFVDQLVASANGAKPDLVAITGDLVDGSPDLLGRSVARLRNLQSKFGTYFVSGNHDYYSGWERWQRALEGMDIEVLRNRRVRIGDLDASFDLIGVDDWSARGYDGYDLAQALDGRDETRASVLLAHQPNNLDAVAAAKIGLQLSGHTHGGQLFPATLIGDVIWGSRNTGLSRHGDSWLYTSRGCGFVGPPMRVGAPPEVVKVILLPA